MDTNRPDPNNTPPPSSSSCDSISAVVVPPMTSSPRCRSGRGGGTKKVGRSVARRDSVSNPGVTIISLDCGWAVRMDVMLGSRMTILMERPWLSLWSGGAGAMTQ